MPLESTSERVVTPETQPSAVRHIPPPSPPAPPGTGWASGAPDEPSRSGIGLDAELELLRFLAGLVRDPLQFLESEPEESPAALQMRAAVADGRGVLINRVRHIHDRLTDGSTQFFGTDLALFKKEMLRLSAAGVLRSVLDRETKADVFTRVSRTEVVGAHRMPELLYRYPLPPDTNPFRLGLMPAGQFTRALLNGLLDVLRNEQNYQTAHRFDREVMQAVLALQHVVRLATPAPEEALPEPRVRFRSRRNDPEERRLREWDRLNGEAA